MGQGDKRKYSPAQLSSLASLARIAPVGGSSSSFFPLDFCNYCCFSRLFAGSTFAATSPTNLEAPSQLSQHNLNHNQKLHKLLNMDADAAKIARDSLEVAFQMSNILDTGLDRHTLSILIALCDLGLNPEALAAVVKELRREVIPLAPSDAARPVL